MPDENTIITTATTDERKRQLRAAPSHLLSLRRGSVYWWNHPFNLSSYSDMRSLYVQTLHYRTQIPHSQSSLVLALIHQSALETCEDLQSLMDHRRFPYWSISSFCCIWGEEDMPWFQLTPQERLLYFQLSMMSKPPKVRQNILCAYEQCKHLENVVSLIGVNRWVRCKLFQTALK